MDSMKERFERLQENQRSQMEAIMKEHQEELDRITSKHRNRLEQLETNLRTEINSLRNYSNIQDEEISKWRNDQNAGRARRQTPKVHFRKKRSLNANNRSCTYYRPDHPDAENPDGKKNKKELEAATNPPKNCLDLHALGHTLNGVYAVQGTKNNVNDQMNFIHCVFKATNATSPGIFVIKLVIMVYIHILMRKWSGI